MGIRTCKGDAAGGERGRYHLGVSYGVFHADISFIGSKDATFERRALSATFERRMSATWTLALGAGVALPGTIAIDGDRYKIRPGWLGAITSSWLLVQDRGRAPFVLLSLTIAASGVTTRYAEAGAASANVDAAAESLLSFDGRLGLLVGKTFWDVLRPYVGVRGFGGPILWRFRGEHVIGGDPRHFQLALGMSSSLPAGTSIFAEVAPLGERGVTVGAGTAF